MAGQRSVSLHLFRKKLQRRRNGKKVNNILAQKKTKKFGVGKFGTGLTMLAPQFFLPLRHAFYCVIF